MGGHAEEMDPAGADLHYEQNVEAAQCDGVEGEEVGGQLPGSLCVQKGPPDGAGAYAVPESNEFSLDAAVAPGGVLLCQP